MQSDPHLLALTMLLEAYQRLGYSPKLGDVPAMVVDTVRGVLDLPDGLAAQFCEQAGIPAEAPALVGFYRRRLAGTAAAVAVAVEVDAGYPAKTDLVLEDGKPTLERRRGADRRPSALALECADVRWLSVVAPETAVVDSLIIARSLRMWVRSCRETPAMPRARRSRS